MHTQFNWFPKYLTTPLGMIMIVQDAASADWTGLTMLCFNVGVQCHACSHWFGLLLMSPV